MFHDGGGLTVRFWGTRGSLPSPGARTSRYGGNTSCVEIRAGGHLLVFDAGSGIRELGNVLAPQMPITGHVFFTHYHWDHIMGFPFFGPLFVPGNELHLYGESKDGRDVGEILSGQMLAPYFPVTMQEEARCDVRVHSLTPGEVVELDGVTVKVCRLNHPGDAIGYRVDHAGRAVVYATDIEHDPETDGALIELARGADALIYDSTYTDAEYAGHIGWGHSTWRAGVDIAKAAEVGQFIIFHHLPERTDPEVAAIERAARQLFAGAVAAQEGMVLDYAPVVDAETRPKKGPNGTAHRSPRSSGKAAKAPAASRGRAPKGSSRRKKTGAGKGRG